jgi:hypothetical protein
LTARFKKTLDFLRLAMKSEEHLKAVIPGFITSGAISGSEAEAIIVELTKAPEEKVNPDKAEEVVLEDMSKLELEALARTKDVELDRRQSKATLLKEVKNIFKG